MAPEACMSSLTFAKTRSIMVAEVSVTLVGLSINWSIWYSEQRKLSCRVWGSNETLLTSQLRSPTNINSLHSASHLWKNISHTLNRSMSEFGGLYQVHTRKDLLCGQLISAQTISRLLGTKSSLLENGILSRIYNTTPPPVLFRSFLIRL